MHYEQEVKVMCQMSYKSSGHNVSYSNRNKDSHSVQNVTSFFALEQAFLKPINHSCFFTLL